MTTFIPGVRSRFSKGSFATSANYCYAVWLLHLVMASRNDLPTVPRIVAELGPGDSLGVGIAALLSGAARFHALDVVEHANVEHNLEIFEEWVGLFMHREAIADNEQFPRMEPKLDWDAFPQRVMTTSARAPASTQTGSNESGNRSSIKTPTI